MTLNEDIRLIVRALLLWSVGELMISVCRRERYIKSMKLFKNTHHRENCSDSLYLRHHFK